MLQPVKGVRADAYNLLLGTSFCCCSFITFARQCLSVLPHCMGMGCAILADTYLCRETRTESLYVGLCMTVYTKHSHCNEYNVNWAY